MSMGHLFFAGMTTAYILVAIQLEERDMIRNFGDKYENYRKQVSMLTPVKFWKGESPEPVQGKAKGGGA
jgi:protein-S-isoprenylcysteine O-methyltransferase Ste14